MEMEPTVRAGPVFLHLQSQNCLIFEANQAQLTPPPLNLIGGLLIVDETECTK
jgi:hypothetical protein